MDPTLNTIMAGGGRVISTNEEMIMRPDGSWATKRTMEIRERDGTVRINVKEQVVESSSWSGPIAARPLITDGENTCNIKGCSKKIHADSPSYCNFHRCRARVVSTGAPCRNKAKDDTTRWCGTHYSTNHGT